MSEFKGFDPNIFMLLELNAFNDSKDFYESVKEEIKAKAIVPTRQLASDLSDELFNIDSKMNLIPTKMVSRIRRDTRFSKNKNLYRPNVWCMFMRDKHAWDNLPCMWFEFFPNSYNYGVGTFRSDTAFLEAYRKELRENPDKFRTALSSVDITGAVLFIDSFKKDKPGIEEVPEDLRGYYNAKSLHFSCAGNEMRILIDGTIREELTYAIRAFAPMYKFFIDICESLIEKGE